ncbi:SLOG family protein [Labrys sedimenti]|uniref:SLOG family protein n=1 Tax=Labrys sedimenti TaxID=3106036 RepID=UPI002ACA4D3A|nr:SLOG family protein [Labrys sp. ZIDIC5]MDZ5450998.1 SLOG family protein [Labrys sp. ZIDIC5]
MTIDMHNRYLAPAPGEETTSRPPAKPRTVLVCGDEAIDQRRVFAILDRLLADEGEFRIVHAGKRGADLLAAKWAVAHRVRSIVERASWLRYGTSAGPLRNEHMLNFYEPFVVIAFPGGKDCADLVARARRSGVRIVEAATF